MHNAVEEGLLVLVQRNAWPCYIALALVCNFYLIRAYINWSNEAQASKAHNLWHFFI